MGRELGSSARGPGAGTISFDGDAEGRELVVGKGSLSLALGKLGGRLYIATRCARLWRKASVLYRVNVMHSYRRAAPRVATEATLRAKHRSTKRQSNDRPFCCLAF